jgi:lipopolysaccharide export system protein LptA
MFARYFIYFSLFKIIPFAWAEGAITPLPEDVNISGDEMRYEMAQNKATVIGNAKATRQVKVHYGSNSPSSSRTESLKADTFEVTFAPKKEEGKQTQGNPSNSNIQAIKATGQVVFDNGRQIMQGRVCHYDVPGEKIICTEDVYIEEGKNKIRGEIGEINLKTQTYTVKKSKTPVRAEIHSQKNVS